jgi:hypothetical protein
MGLYDVLQVELRVKKQEARSKKQEPRTKNQDKSWYILNLPSTILTFSNTFDDKGKLIAIR